MRPDRETELGNIQLALITETEWMEHAACKDCDNWEETFFPKLSSVLHKKYCSQCSVWSECFDYAMDVESTRGIWAFVGNEYRSEVSAGRKTKVDAWQKVLHYRESQTTAIQAARKKRPKKPYRPRPRKTQCSNGHKYTEDNVYMSPTGRKCRTCIRDSEGRRVRRPRPDRRLAKTTQSEDE